VPRTAQVVERKATAESGELAIDSRLRAAQLLKASHPQLARKFLLEAAAAVQKSKDTGWVQNAMIMQWIRKEDPIRRPGRSVDGGPP